MDAILPAALAGVFFGALSVAQRAGLARFGDVEAATVITCGWGLAVSLPITALAGDAGDLFSADIWPYLLAGLLAPGGGQLLFLGAVRAIGAARSATLISAAPLLSAVPAFLILDEPVHPALPVAAVLIVAGAVILSGERLTGGFRRIGIVLALGSAGLVAARDNFVRAFAREDDVAGLAAGTASLVAALVFLFVYLVVVRRGATVDALRGAARPFVLAGVLLGLAYACNLEALSRGRVTVVSPFYATEALWAVLFAYVFLDRSERIGPRLVVAALLMVAGAALISAFG